MAVLVLGGYGLIGAAIVDRLVDDGREVIGVGRDIAAAQRRRPDVAWRRCDLASLQTPEAWAPMLAGVDTVVNAAGALQDSARDDLEAVQYSAMVALYAAAPRAGVQRIVQISAVGADNASPLPFLATKARADAALWASGLDHVILRPALVISPQAYGGTALLRGLAGLPLATPLVSPDSPVQTVWIGDVAEAASRAVAGHLPSGSMIDLAEAEARTLRETVRQFRAWLGFRPAPAPALPAWAAVPVSAVADFAGLLGWRSPLRSTALKIMASGVQGDPEAGPRAIARPLKSLSQSLAAMPCGPQERWFARLWPLKPVALIALAAFWALSGVVGVVEHRAAVAILTARDIPGGLATIAVIGGGLLDAALGVALLYRPASRWALFGMGLTACGYLVSATVLTPDLWLDPLGAIAKIIPILLATGFLLAVLDER